MKTLTAKQKILCVVLIAIVLAGIAIISTVGFNKSILYSNHKRVNIYLGIEYNESDIKNIVKEVTSDDNYLLQKADLSENYISISFIDISDEIVEELKTKIYEKYSVKEDLQSVKTEEIPAIKIREAVVPYITPIIISAIVLTIYLVIRFRKQNMLKVGMLSVLGTILVELVYFSLIAIFRIPFNDYIMPISLFVYYIWYILITYKLKK